MYEAKGFSGTAAVRPNFRVRRSYLREVLLESHSGPCRITGHVV
jgi:hypothetical protein